jgi:parallel beta-helix repeat protein
MDEDGRAAGVVDRRLPGARAARHLMRRVVPAVAGRWVVAAVVRRWAVVVVAALVTWSGAPGVALASQTFMVSNANDSGAGSLRAAIKGVDADSSDSGNSPDMITVTGGPFTVTPGTPLSQITRPVVLDGTGITINDGMAPAASPPPALNDALVLQTGSDGSTLSGLTIEGAAGGAGIAIVSSANTVRDNRISPSLGASNEFGITVFSSNNTIGSTVANDGNLISGATGDGIFVIGPSGSGPAVTGNVIEGNTISGNGGSGVEIRFGAGNTVGGTATGTPNVIYGNDGAGVLVSGQGSSGNLIDGNFIGTDANGLGSPQNPGAQLPNGGGGIKFAESASGNSVAGGTVLAGSSGSAIDAGGGANQVSTVSLAGGPMPLIIGGQSWTVTAGAATPSGNGVSIPVTVTGAPPGASVEVDLLDASCAGAAASLPYLAGTTVSIGPSATGTGTIIASGDPPLPVFESSDANGPLNLADPCPPPGPTGPTGPTGAAPGNTAAPQITGDAVPGGTLTATTGTWSNHPTSFADQWRECNTSGDACHDIPGATKSTYVLAESNLGDTIRVAVTATNAAGSTSATSDATHLVTAPQVGATLGPTQTSGATVTLSAGCPSSFILVCILFFNFTADQPPRPPPPPPPPPAPHAATVMISKRRKHHVKVVVVGRAKIDIRAGHSKTVRITLNQSGRRLLAKSHRLKVKLTITQNGHTVSSRPITFTAKPPRQHKHR